MKGICSLLLLLTIQVVTVSKVVIVTPLGPVEGDLVTSYDGADYQAFNGIPYAMPPIGNYRFKTPRPVKPWKDIYKPPQRSLHCVQEVRGYISGNEDCLYLYVYTPVNSSFPLSVMVYLHGGGYKSGSGDLSNRVGHLMAKGVIVVSVNYRLGPFGFLSTEDNEAPGNYGLQDQITALVWIQQNIASFGGDPTSVTLFGSGTGAAMAHLLMLSPMGKGLFHRAILQSGCAINPFSITKTSLIRTQTLAEKLDCPKAPSSDLLKCVRGKHAQEVAYAGMTDIDEVFGMLPIIWAPRIDEESDIPILPQDPLETLLSGPYARVPVMAGFVRDEGLVMYGTGNTDFENQYGVLKHNFTLACHQLFNTGEFLMTERQLVQLCAKLKRHYVDNDKYNDIFDQRYIDMIGDMMFRSGILKSASLMAKALSIYLYSFDFFDEATDTHERYVDEDDKVVLLKGVTHGKELEYIFSKDLYEEGEITEERKNMTKIMTRAWTSFAKNGVPKVRKASSQWKKATQTRQKVMSLNLVSYLRKDYRSDDIDFIEELLKHIWYKAVLRDEL